MSEKQPIAFKAEIKQLLNILIHSLYTEREIFLRELISNASDALTQLHFVSLTEREIHDPDAELAIRISVDEDENMITISDSGIGMTEEELIQNLGTIAQSGARAFLEAAQENETQQAVVDVIGQFGVGFYAVFMVAEWVRVTSRSFRPEATAAVWYATGEDTFTVGPAEKETRGTTIEIKLNDDALEFAKEFKMNEITKKHSDYVAFPIYIGESEEQANRQTALWRQSPREVEGEAYTEFFKHLTLDFQDPLDQIHYVADAPLQVYALLYLPSSGERGMFSTRKEDGIKLYVRKVLIQEYSTDLLPRYYRFIQGVVDTEDLPLNVSRETLQDSPIIARLRKIITNQVTNKLTSMAEKDTEKYVTFWENYSPFIKEGIASEPGVSEKLAPLVRFYTTAYPETWVSFAEYIDRIKDGQDKIYYIMGDDPHSIARSPHLDYFRDNGYEVITLTDPMDSFMLMGLRSFGDFELQNVAASDLELPGDGDAPEDTAQLDALTDDDFKSIADRFKTQLDERVSDVRATDRLTNSVARLVDPDGSMGQEMQRVNRMLERDYEVPVKVLELNPRHTILAKLNDLPADNELSAVVMEQIYESALLIEGLHPDPASMLTRIQQLMEAALD